MTIYIAAEGLTPDCVCAAIGSGKNCGAEHGEYRCTRPQGHEGPHVICGIFTHQGFQWTDGE